VRIALVADSYPPLRTSGAVQLRDLSQEFRRQGHDVTVLVPAPDLGTSWALEELEGVQVLRLSAMQTKDIGYVRRTLGELLLSSMMLRGLQKSPLAQVKWDAVVWYSPTIFLGRLVGALKQATGARTYLILRDVFPEWALDMGLLKKGPVYSFFKYFERIQYSVADVIGVQSHSNLAYMEEWSKQPGRRLEVLQNWLAPAANVGCSVDIEKTLLAGRRIVVYAGNMGVAQGMDMVIGLAEKMRERREIGFLFVGRGSDVPRLKALVEEKRLDNVLFHDEIEPKEVPMTTIAVIGLGYVGLPLAVEFGKKQKTVGFDLHQEKVDAYARHVDPTGEVSSEDLKAAVHLTCSTDPKIISEADFIIVAVPTPVDEAHQPTSPRWSSRARASAST
jgi:glycosyltransferase involved in cell wall biosynthesis